MYINTYIYIYYIYITIIKHKILKCSVISNYNTILCKYSLDSSMISTDILWKITKSQIINNGYCKLRINVGKDLLP